MHPFLSTLRAGWPALLITLVCLLLYLFPQFGDLLRWSRPAIAQGEWWRLFSGHFVHLGANHLFMNLLALLLAMYIFSDQLRPFHWLLMVSIGALSISIMLYQFSPQLQWYVGLSGLLHTLFIFAALLVAPGQPKIAALFILFLLAKIGWEQWQGPSQTTIDWIGGNVITDAHLFGAVTGFLLVPVCYALRPLLRGKPHANRR